MEINSGGRRISRTGSPVTGVEGINLCGDMHRVGGSHYGGEVGKQFPFIFLSFLSILSRPLRRRWQCNFPCFPPANPLPVYLSGAGVHFRIVRNGERNDRREFFSLTLHRVVFSGGGLISDVAVLTTLIGSFGRNNRLIWPSLNIFVSALLFKTFIEWPELRVGVLIKKHLLFDF